MVVEGKALLQRRRKKKEVRDLYLLPVFQEPPLKPSLKREKRLSYPPHPQKERESSLI